MGHRWDIGETSYCLIRYVPSGGFRYNWLLDSAMLVLPYILAGSAVPASVNGVYYTSCTALGGIVY